MSQKQNKTVHFEDTDTHQGQTFTIILDDDATVYLEQEGIRNTDAYLIQLLKEEKKRQEAKSGNKGKPAKQDLDALISSTPDTSGYPEMESHFGGESKSKK